LLVARFEVLEVHDRGCLEHASPGRPPFVHDDMKAGCSIAFGIRIDLGVENECLCAPWPPFQQEPVSGPDRFGQSSPLAQNALHADYPLLWADILSTHERSKVIVDDLQLLLSKS
jgi:hypothetical protein